MKHISEAFASIVNGESNVNTVHIDIHEPEFGWMEFRLLTSDNQKITIELSDIYNPFPDIRAFIEGCYSSSGTTAIAIDCELYNVNMSITEITTTYKNSIYKRVGLLTIYDNIESEEGEEIISLVDMYEFAKSFYLKLKLRVLNSQSIADNWNIESNSDNSGTNEECRERLFKESIFSEYIERCISRI